MGRRVAYGWDMNHPAAPLPLNADGRSTLDMWVHIATARHRVVSRAKALLMAGGGVANSRIAAALGISRNDCIGLAGTVS